jgi:glycosyltransferase involved in cell wall biosynthesis
VDDELFRPYAAEGRAMRESLALKGPVIGFLGRLDEEKGLDVLLRACVRLYGPWTLTVAGTGPEQETLEALAERLGIASRVTWLGGIPRASS